ncbi:MAG TPA: hypothetical protein VFT95_17480 [Micromonosporaceae bacterium]|nr:hypothetical protein [Micromonosporaceae bacterium]
MPRGGQARGVPAGAAGRVEGGAARQPADDLRDERLLVREQPVARLVVRGRPDPVAVDGADGLGLDPVGTQRRRVQQPADLGDARLGERAVAVTGERPQQGDPSSPSRYASGLW